MSERKRGTTKKTEFGYLSSTTFNEMTVESFIDDQFMVGTILIAYEWTMDIGSALVWPSNDLGANYAWLARDSSLIWARRGRSTRVRPEKAAIDHMYSNFTLDNSRDIRTLHALRLPTSVISCESIDPDSPFYVCRHVFGYTPPFVNVSSCSWRIGVSSDLSCLTTESYSSFNKCPGSREVGSVKFPVKGVVWDLTKAVKPSRRRAKTATLVVAGKGTTELHEASI
ncbi:hypothetical protein BKA70DRAFT_1527037 [Coprinopsis sp. MPI-PUGE-AT-0042]|nr:hypothetical protein BKA70DRAFT_1527037 [Coprinopsis sp. MPI-PUGE-AT-0042]